MADGIDLDAAVRKIKTALDDMTMPLGRDGWESCVSDILEAAPALVAEVERLRADNETKETEIVLALRMHETQFNRANRVTAERDAALARIRAAEQRCDQAVEENQPPNAVNSEVIWLAGDIRAALAAPAEDIDQ